MKTIFTLALVLCLGTFASAQIPSYVPTNGLVGWWPFNGNANDESGNGNHGTVNGAALATDRFGNSGKAYSFDINNNSNIIVPPNRSIDSCLSFSANLWIKVNANNNGWYNRYLTKGQGTTGYQYVFANQYVGIYFYFNQPHFQTNFLPIPNSWHMVSVTYNYQSNSAFNKSFFYVDGQKIDSFNTLNQITPNNQPLIIGNELYSNNNTMNGLLDDIAIYNRALSAAEVQQLYLGNCTQPTFTAQPQNKSVGQGQTTTFAVQVDTTATFQWQMNLGLGAGWVNIPQSSLFSGDTTATLSVQGRSTIDGAQFRCIATACQNDTSNAATLTVTSTSSILGSVAGVPGKINYQGAAMDSLGKPMKNQTIALKLSVLDSSSTGAASFVETHSTPTNGSGLFYLQIGGGTALSGTFDSIPWANGRNKYLKTELNQNGTWVNLGTSQLVSVPYALVSGYSKESEFSKSSATLRDSLGNAYQIKTVNGQPTLVSAPGNVFSPGAFACGQALTYAGESYPTVQIGSQCWFQKNVNAGTMVLGANDQTNNGTLEKYCYNNDPAKCGIFGGLYQWAEAVQYQNGASNTASPSPAFSGNVKGICPTGWHVPSDGEWCTMTTYLDSTVNCSTTGWTGTDVYLKMSSWTSPNSLNSNISGFSAIPGGHKNSTAFYNIGSNTFFWSTSEISFTTGLNIELTNNFPERGRTINPKSHGFSVRCLKD